MFQKALDLEPISKYIQLNLTDSSKFGCWLSFQLTSFGSCSDASFLARLIFLTLLNESMSSGKLT